MKGRVFVMGDIHGNARGLQQCLDKCKFDYEKDTLIQLGDVADGWSEVSECVDILTSIDNLIAIRGNHDVWVDDWLEKGRSPVLWTQQGGQATLESYIRTQRFLDGDHKSFWKQQKDWYIDEQNRLFIHAGWAYYIERSKMHSGMTHKELFLRQASLPVNAGTKAKECHWDRELLRGAKSAFFNKASKNDFDYIEDVDKRGGSFTVLETFKEVYIGHTAHNLNKPMWLGNLCNMDTGSGWYGSLTIMDVDTREYWVSDKAMDLYPDEKGRR